MPQPLNSEYIWGINAQNQGNLSPSELVGLGSLAPQGGYGLEHAPTATPLDPYGSLPTPKFSPNAAASFDFVGPGAGYTVPAGVERMTPAPAANVDANGSSGAPYFDPNYPYESMLALKNYLAPQVAEGVEQSMQSRGLDYTGLGPAAQSEATNYLGQLAPLGETGPQAMENDFTRLYGAGVADSLASGSKVPNEYLGYDAGGNVQYGDVSVAPSIPGATPPGGASNEGSSFVDNPAYNAKTNPNVPQFGLYDLSTKSVYPSPGYWYNPNSAPDAANIPWLNPATPYGGSGEFSPNV